VVGLLEADMKAGLVLEKKLVDILKENI